MEQVSFSSHLKPSALIVRFRANALPDRWRDLKLFDPVAGKRTTMIRVSKDGDIRLWIRKSKITARFVTMFKGKINETNNGSEIKGQFEIDGESVYHELVKIAVVPAFQTLIIMLFIAGMFILSINYKNIIDLVSIPLAVPLLFYAKSVRVPFMAEKLNATLDELDGAKKNLNSADVLQLKAYLEMSCRDENFQLIFFNLRDAGELNP